MSADLRYQTVNAFAESAKLPSETEAHEPRLRLVLNGSPDGMIRNRVKEFRLRAGLTQEALGEKINASYSTISRMERDETELEVADLEKLAAVFGCAPLELITDVPVPEGEEEQALMRAVKGMTPEGLAALIAAAKAMPKKG